MGEQDFIEELIEVLNSEDKLFIRQGENVTKKKELRNKEKYDQILKQINSICTLLENELKGQLEDSVASRRIRKSVITILQKQVANGKIVFNKDGKIDVGMLSHIIMQQKDKIKKEVILEKENDLENIDSKEDIISEQKKEEIKKRIEKLDLDLTEDEEKKLEENISRAEEFKEKVKEYLKKGYSFEKCIELASEGMSREEIIDTMYSLAITTGIEQLEQEMQEKQGTNEETAVEQEQEQGQQPENAGEENQGQSPNETSIKGYVIGAVQGEYNEYELIEFVTKKENKDYFSCETYMFLDGLSSVYDQIYGPIKTDGRQKNTGVSLEGQGSEVDFDISGDRIADGEMQNMWDAMQTTMDVGEITNNFEGNKDSVKEFGKTLPKIVEKTTSITPGTIGENDKNKDNVYGISKMKNFVKDVKITYSEVREIDNIIEFSENENLRNGTEGR